MVEYAFNVFGVFACKKMHENGVCLEEELPLTRPRTVLTDRLLSAVQKFVIHRAWHRCNPNQY